MCPIKSFDRVPQDFMMVLQPIIVVVVKACRHVYLTKDSHLGFTVGNLVLLKFEQIFKQTANR